jgi:hypothetical protein
MKIGLLGEAPNDTTAIQNLLSRKYPELNFVALLDRIHGSMLDNKKAISRLLRIEYEEHSPDIIIFIRDLDGLEHNKSARRKRQEIFSYSNHIVDKIGISLLNIFEIEALILADIAAFNILYGCGIPTIADSMTVVMPKEFLINATKKVYNESHNPHLFTLLNFDVIKQNCRYFSTFITRLDKMIFAKS